MKLFACWWLHEWSWNLKGRREELSPAGCAFPQKVTVLFWTQTMNREVMIIIFLLSLLLVQSGKAKAILKVKLSDLDLNSGLIVLTSFLFSLFLGGEGTRTLGMHLFNACWLHKPAVLVALQWAVLTGHCGQRLNPGTPFCRVFRAGKGHLWRDLGFVLPLQINLLCSVFIVLWMKERMFWFERESCL